MTSTEDGRVVAIAKHMSNLAGSAMAVLVKEVHRDVAGVGNITSA